MVVVAYYISDSAQLKITDNSNITASPKMLAFSDNRKLFSKMFDNLKTLFNSKKHYDSNTTDTSKSADGYRKIFDNLNTSFDLKMHKASKATDNWNMFANLKLDSSKIANYSNISYNWKASAKQKIQNKPETYNAKMYSSRPKRILYFNPIVFQLSRKVKENSPSLFNSCEIRNCEMVYDKTLIDQSDAILLTSWADFNIEKRPGQVWIMLQWESTQMHRKLAAPGAPAYMKNRINWIVSYSSKADIHLPYGQLKLLPIQARPYRNYIQIANNKTKDAIWIVSHCQTYSKRENYVEILKKYISIDILGKCGEKWVCGQRPIHDECFDIYNTSYRYNLAFENSLCEDYITEKFYENYKYDILQVVRGNANFKKPIDVSQEAYISASDFKNPHELGKFLKYLSSNPERYASLLRKKDEYTVVPYLELFRNAGCEMCKRLHSVDTYSSIYNDTYRWMQKNEPCYEPKDINGVR